MFACVEHNEKKKKQKKPKIIWYNQSLWAHLQQVTDVKIQHSVIYDIVIHWQFTHWKRQMTEMKTITINFILNGNAPRDRKMNEKNDDESSKCLNWICKYQFFFSRMIIVTAHWCIEYAWMSTCIQIFACCNVKFVLG